MSLQDQFAAKSICFGCGPANRRGLRIKSIPAPDGVRCTFTPEPHHQAFPEVINGGIIGAVLDCHSNWTAAWALMQERKLAEPPCTVTSEFHVKLLRPTPLVTFELFAKPVEIKGDVVKVSATLSAGGKVCATCDGTFVAVKPGHPAYHRW